MVKGEEMRVDGWTDGGIVETKIKRKRGKVVVFCWGNKFI